MSDTNHKAYIYNQECEIRCFDKDHLVLTNGARYEFVPASKLSFQFALQIITSVNRLIWRDCNWSLDGKRLQDIICAETPTVDTVRKRQWALLNQFLTDEFPEDDSFNKEFGKPKPGSVLDYISGLVPNKTNETERKDICAVAWFEGNNNPVLLRSFSLITPPQTVDTENKSRSLERRLEKAERAANMNIREALNMWIKFDPRNMATTTKARIEKAVKLYVTDQEKRSLAKIAAEFNVSRKTVSTWFATFTEETGFPVVQHRRHESVKARLRAEAGGESGILAGGSGSKTPVRGNSEKTNIRGHKRPF